MRKIPDSEVSETIAPKIPTGEVLYKLNMLSAGLAGVQLGPSPKATGSIPFKDSLP